MIIDIAGSSMVGASLDDAARLLKTSGNIVRYIENNAKFALRAHYHRVSVIMPSCVYVKYTNGLLHADSVIHTCFVLVTNYRCDTICEVICS